MEIQEVKEQLKEIFRTVINNDKWITIHPNGEDGKGRHLLLKDGESPKEAIERTYGDKKESKKKFETHYIVWQKNGEPYILDKTSFENWKENNKEHISTTDIDYITHSDIEKLKKDAEARGIDVEKEGGENYLISQIADLKKEDKKQSLSTPAEKEGKKDGKEEKKSTFKPVKGIMQSLKDDYEAGKINAKEIAKELSKANLTPYLLDDNEALEKIGVKQSDTKDKQPDSKVEKATTLDDKIKEYENKIPKNYRRDNQTKALWLYKNSYITRSEWEKFRIDNSKEQDMALIEELKKLITKVENDKEGEQDMTVENEKVDKRKLIDEVGGILKGKVDDEIIRTIIGKLEKVAYEKSEADTADNEKEEDAENCKKVKNEDEKDEKEVKEVKEEVKEDVENKCKNSVDNSKTDYFAEMNKIYNAAQEAKKENIYISQAQREQDAVDYFKK